MTSSRIVRGTKARVFLYVCVILVIVGVIACYNSTLSQLDSIKKASDLCHKQEEHLNTQLQVITDYKQRLEKSLKTEKAEQQHLKQEYETKLEEEKSRYGKATNEASLHYNSLKQQFNLLQTEHDDFKSDCSLSKKQQLDEISVLQTKLKDVQEELKKVKTSKETLKTQFLEVQNELDSLKDLHNKTVNGKFSNENQIKYLTKNNFDIKQELEALKEKCNHTADTLLSFHLQPSDTLRSPSSVSSKSPLGIGDQPPAEQSAVLKAPGGSDKTGRKGPSSSSTLSSANLNGAQPLGLPSVSPASSSSRRVSAEAKRDQGVLQPPHTNKEVPRGIVPVPPNMGSENELPGNDIVDNRYMNQLAANPGNQHPLWKHLEPPQMEPEETADRENNGAHEELDGGLEGALDGLGERPGAPQQPVLERQHIDAMGARGFHGAAAADYKDPANDVQLEENEEDDEADDYNIDRRQKQDPAVRN